VTGGSRGIGCSISLTLAREGAAVVVNYLSNRKAAQALVDHIEDGGGQAIAVQADVFQADGCRALVDAAVERFGRIDICVIGPGAGWHMEPPDGLDTNAALTDAQQELAPLYHLMPLVLPGMYEQEWGRLIGIALHPTKLPPAYSYNAAKAARSAALRLAAGDAWPHGVTVNAIAPSPVGEIKTLKKAVEQCGHGSAWQKRRTTSPQDIAEGIAFLCSEAGRFITGCELPYDYR
jgi:NAD(P)-dependent dehydrogenase (short-subunit alcohol dehydrogenase family)